MRPLALVFEAFVGAVDHGELAGACHRGSDIVVIKIIGRADDPLIGKHKALTLAAGYGRTGRDLRLGPDAPDAIFVLAVEAEVVARDTDHMLRRIDDGHHEAAQDAAPFS